MSEYRDPAPERLLKLDQLFNAESNILSTESLLDALIALFDECCNSTLRKEKSIAKFVEFAKPVVNKVKSLRLCRDDFEILQVVGTGAFGEVAMVQLKNTEEIYAMKILNKWEMLKRAETACFKEERDVMVNGDRNWITNLHYAFQDDKNLYLVMDYYVGGDLLTLLSKCDNILPENMARFYMAEMILAVVAVHKLGYVHRDLKPDNVMLQKDGHLKLADFGSCLKIQENGFVQSNIAVGTPDYISPELLRAMEDSQGLYGTEVDFWSLGICMYEMLYGETPFYAESLIETYSKIMSHQEFLDFPDDSNVSEDAIDLIKKLICAKEERLGKRGLLDFKDHPFFANIDWDSIRDCEAPYIPEVSSPTDTSNFEINEQDFTPCNTRPPTVNAAFTGHHLSFIGFTYTHGSSLSSGLDSKNDPSSRIEKLEKEKAELIQKVIAFSSNQPQLVSVPSIDRTGNSNQNSELYEKTIAQLKDEVQILKKRLADEAGNVKTAKEASVEELEDKIKKLKAKNRQLVMDKSDIQREMDEVSDRLHVQQMECEEAIKHREHAKQDYQELNSTLIETNKSILKMETLLKEKQAESCQLREKFDKVKSDLKANHLAMKDYENKLKKAENEIQIQSDLIETLQHQISSVSAESKSDEINHLNEEIQRLNLRYSEAVKSESVKATDSGEQWKILYEEQMKVVEEKNVLLDQFKEEMATLTREHQTHIESLDKLYDNHNKQKELDLNEYKTQNETLKFEIEKLEESVKTSCFNNTEIQELLNLVKDETEVRDFFENFTYRLTKEIEAFKANKDADTSLQSNMNGTLNTPMTIERGWGSIRSQKQGKIAKREAEQSLQAEIRDKQRVAIELKRVREAYAVTESQNSELKTQISKTRKELDLKGKENEALRNQLLNYSKQIASNSEGNANLRYSFEHNRSASNSFYGVPADIPNYAMSNYCRPISTTRLDQRFNQNSQMHNYCNAEFDASSMTHRSNREVLIQSPQTPSISSQSNISVNNTHNTQTTHNTITPPTSQHQKPHRFVHSVFKTPTKCGFCTTILVGLERQGIYCSDCHYSCHVNCAQKGLTTCPVPKEELRPLGIDPQTGIGTAYEGLVKVPKPKGIKQGWKTNYVVVCDFKLYFYDCSIEKNKVGNIESSIQRVLDMKDPDFAVSTVGENDVIHASKSDIPKIFRITTSQIHTCPGVDGKSNGLNTTGSTGSNGSGNALIDASGLRQYLLVMADTEDEKKKWITALNELKNILRKSKLPDKSAFVVKEICDISSLAMLRTARCATVIDKHRIVLGFSDHGLLCVDLETEKFVAIGGDKENSRRNVEKVEYDAEEQLLIVMTGPLKERMIRLIPTIALDGRDYKWIKIPDTKNCHNFCIGGGNAQSTYHCICVAIRKSVFVYQIDRSEKRFQKLRELAMPGEPQSLVLTNGMFFVGAPSTFRFYFPC
uniref:Non-specific serine/threonine protein kinase n=1 Tax=Rhabditophanes sp. KR3021 TaxID=114890 RepID=A0AC35UBI3_9BILA